MDDMLSHFISFDRCSIHAQYGLLTYHASYLAMGLQNYMLLKINIFKNIYKYNIYLKYFVSFYAFQRLIDKF